jgi:hypothetical protein
MCLPQEQQVAVLMALEDRNHIFIMGPREGS